MTEVYVSIARCFDRSFGALGVGRGSAEERGGAGQRAEVEMLRRGADRGRINRSEPRTAAAVAAAA